MEKEKEKIERLRLVVRYRREGHNSPLGAMALSPRPTCSTASNNLLPPQPPIQQTPPPPPALQTPRQTIKTIIII